MYWVFYPYGHRDEIRRDLGSAEEGFPSRSTVYADSAIPRILTHVSRDRSVLLAG